MTSSPQGLTEAQEHQYWSEGFLTGLEVLTAEQMARVRDKLISLEAAEIAADPERWADPNYQPWEVQGSPWWHWFHGMIRHPRILAAARSILGPNVLIRNADIFVKAPASPTRISWHVDCTAPTSEANKLLTIWVAISDSTTENGTVEWVKGSHAFDLPPEIQDKYSLSYSKEGAAKLDELPRAQNLLRAGQMSLHHFRTVHRSGGNLTEAARIGLTLRVMSSDTTPTAAETGTGILLAGENIPGHFNLVQELSVSWGRSGRVELI
jgi:hypothetical protein